MSTVVNPLLQGDSWTTAALAFPVLKQDVKGSDRNAKNFAQIPDGAMVLYSSISGNRVPVGYADPKSSKVTLFSNADKGTVDSVSKLLTAKGLVATSTTAGNLFDTAANVGTNQKAPNATVKANLTSSQVAAVQKATGVTPKVAGNGTVDFGALGAGGLNTTGQQVKTPALASNMSDFDSETGPLKDALVNTKAAPKIDFLSDHTSTTNKSFLDNILSKGEQIGHDLLSGIQGALHGQKSPMQATQDLFKLSPANLKTLESQLTAAGYGNLNADGVVTTDLMAAYGKLLVNTYNYQQSGQPNMTPGKLLSQQAAAAAAASGKSATQTDVQLTDTNTAGGYLTDAFKTNLGRAPSAAEVATFTQALNAAQKANPTVTTSTANATGTSKSNSQQGGFGNPQGYAENYVKQNFGPEASADKISSAYSIMQQAMGSGGLG